MKFFSAGAAAFSALCLATLPGNLPAQDAKPTQSSTQQTTPAGSQSTPKGQVIFSRSIDENGQAIQTGAATAQAEIKNVTAPAAEDADRRAVTFTALDLDVHLRTAEQQIAVRAQLTVRNDGKTPLTKIPLQISSSLNWERIRVDDKDIASTVATLNSDTDHTGQLHEAAVPLADPLAPGASVKVDATYSGAIAANAARLTAIGTPDDAALHSDWDEISTVFTGLRGFGNVVWYPVASVPVILGDGARVFDEIGEHKLRLGGAKFSMHLAVEYPAGQAPAVVLINGISVPLAVTQGEQAKGDQADAVLGVATASATQTLGFEAPSLFVAMRTAHAAGDVNLWTTPEDDAAASAWNAAAVAVTPFVQEWLGKRPSRELAVIDLPDVHDAPFETGAMLAMPVRMATPDQLQGVMVHALTHAYIHGDKQAPPAWLDEGLATFMGALWTEKKLGRERALESLESGRAALALAEPASPGESTGQPLARATSPVYYRTKAAYVLWMLRDIAGDQALSAALRAGELTGANPAGTAGTAGASPLEKLIEQAGTDHDLSWFFSDWVSADHGLPDLSIESVFPSSPSADSTLVAVNLANKGYAAAEVPLTVRSDVTSITQRVMIPARGKVAQRILIQGKPTEVDLNDGGVPETQASVHVTNLSGSGEAQAQPAVPKQ